MLTHLPCFNCLASPCSQDLAVSVHDTTIQTPVFNPYHYVSWSPLFMGKGDVVDVIHLDCSQALYIHGILMQKLRIYVWVGRADSLWLKLGCTSGLIQRNQW